MPPNAKPQIEKTMLHHASTPLELSHVPPVLKSFSARVFAAFLLLTTLTPLRAQDASESPSGTDIFSKWMNMVSKTQAEQPHWVTPLVTVTPRLEQEYRYDQSLQATAGGNRLTSYGGGKGLEIIPAEPVEIIAGIPAWQAHKESKDRDGFADDSFLLKYRLLSANEENGNYILTAFMGATVPTGSFDNTSDRYTFTPAIAGGKGWVDSTSKAPWAFRCPRTTAPTRLVPEPRSRSTRPSNTRWVR